MLHILQIYFKIDLIQALLKFKYKYYIIYKYLYFYLLEYG